MNELLTKNGLAEDAARRLNELLEAHAEWFLSAQDASIRTTPLRKNEFDVRVSQGRLIFSYWSDAGAVAWRIVEWKKISDKLVLQATRNMNRTRAVLELIPRASATSVAAEMSETRRAVCVRLASLAAQQEARAQIEKADLSVGVRRNEPGRYARIVLRRNHQERIAVTGIVTEPSTGDADALLSSALVWFLQAREKAQKPRVQKLWIIAGGERLAALKQRVALLRDELRERITLWEVNDEWQTLEPSPQLNEAELWPEARVRLLLRKRTGMEPLGESAREIMALAPEAIDVVRARHGETLRFHGLAFARVRRVMNIERVWFGFEGQHRRLLNDSTRDEWRKLLDELALHRRAGAQHRQHVFYRAAPEAWLESLLRRNITRLDPGLIIAPLHAQFRATPVHSEQKIVGVERITSAARPVDLLALRRDGRLVVIELKVNEDREHVLQGADYWQRIYAHHRAGHIKRARLFGEANITNDPPLVYLVAPMLRFHRSFAALARCIRPEIEMYRFDINEDWRAGVRVMRRQRVN
jgi:hypothetical protein